jgi:anti-anti-sigma regulatory factor
MSVLVEIGEKNTLIRAAGELDLSVAGELKSALMTALESPRDSLLDLQRVSGIDLSCTQLLLAASREFGLVGHTLTMEDPAGTFAAVLLEYGFKEAQ